MPTVLIIFGLRVVVYPNDHRPAHVHVIGNGCESVFNLCCSSGIPELRENYGFSLKELVKISEELESNMDLLCKRWSEIHEDY